MSETKAIDPEGDICCTLKEWIERPDYLKRYWDKGVKRVLLVPGSAETIMAIMHSRNWKIGPLTGGRTLKQVLETEWPEVEFVMPSPDVM